MFGNTALIQQNMSHNTHSREQIRRRAVQMFWNGRFTALLNQLWTRFWGRTYELKSLNDVTAVNERHYAGIHQVSITLIQGSEGRSNDFDHQFRPLRAHNQDRWVSVTTAKQTGKMLPPVDLIQVNEIYYVRDGHHRISVARTMGQATIDAIVTIWSTKAE
ncbi:MAG: ParB N-terminal domain-containing protein [Chloroflexi bacterium]|nr:ParB N-terminal domain-containing protein [Chloroflexota bacterium]